MLRALVVVALLVVPAFAQTTRPASTDELDAIAAHAFPAGEPGAAVLVARGEQVLLRKAYGLADLDARRPLAPDDRFRIGSVTKTFASAAVLQQIEAGALALGDPVSKHLPDVDPALADVTVEQLLTHTSGVPNYTALQGFALQQRRARTPAEVVAFVAGKPLAFAPGARFDYSNTNYALLGMLVEKASGLAWADYVQQKFAGPLGLARTAVGPDDAGGAGRAVGWQTSLNPLDADGWARAPAYSMSVPYAAGNLESTVDDLRAWALAWADGKVVPAARRDAAWTPATVREGRSLYGHGWVIETLADGRRLVGHDGGINGFASSLLLVPDERLVVVVLRNTTEDPPPGAVAHELVTAALGLAPPPAATGPTTLPADRVRALVGTYAVSPKFKLVVTEDGGQLYVRATGQARLTLDPTADARTFRVREVSAAVRFADGEPAPAATLVQNGRELPAPREP